MLALFLLATWSASAASPLSVEAQHADLDLVYDALVEGHPGLYWHVSPGALSDAFDGARSSVRANASPLEFYRLLAPVVAQVRCGHTGVLPPAEVMEAALGAPHSPPVRVAVDDGRLFVIESLGSPSVPAGAELLSINGRDASTIVAQLMAGWSFGHDGGHESGRLRATERGFAAHYTLLVELADHFDVTYATGDEVVEATLEPSAWADMVVPAGAPLALHIDGTSAVLRMATLDRAPIEAAGLDFDTFVRKSLRQLRRSGVERLVVDLRDNGGGNTSYGFELMAWLADEPFVYLDHQEATRPTWSFLPHTDLRSDFALPGQLADSDARAKRYDHAYHAVRTEPRRPRRRAFDGEVRVLVNGGTFSAASDLAGALQRQGAVVYGEETGGGAAAYTAVEFAMLNLPHSGVRLRIPLVAQFTTADGEPGRGVFPDVPIRTSVRDILEGRDPQLEAAVSAPSSGADAE